MEALKSFLQVSSGYGDGYGDGIKRFCGKDVFDIDGLQTIIDHIHGNVAHGSVINDDLTTKKCFVVKNGNLFAHGETLKDAMSALREKLLDGMSEEERVAEFMKSHNAKDTYTVRDLYEWHHLLTGSCEMGRNQFAKEHGLLDMNNTRLTVREFIDLTRNAYGGSVIRLLEESYKARLDGGKW